MSGVWACGWGCRMPPLRRAACVPLAPPLRSSIFLGSELRATTARAAPLNVPYRCNSVWSGNVQAHASVGVGSVNQSGHRQCGEAENVILFIYLFNFLQHLCDKCLTLDLQPSLWPLSVVSAADRHPLCQSLSLVCVYLRFHAGGLC